MCPPAIWCENPEAKTSNGNGTHKQGPTNPHAKSCDQSRDGTRNQTGQYQKVTAAKEIAWGK
jgi:hypothetical protein